MTPGYLDKPEQTLNKFKNLKPCYSLPQQLCKKQISAFSLRLKANTDSTRTFRRSTLCSLISRCGPILSPPLSGQRLLYQPWVNILCKSVTAEIMWHHGGHGQGGVASSKLKTHSAGRGRFFSSLLS